MTTPPTDETQQSAGAPGSVAREAPTEQQESRPGTPKRIAAGQTVCGEKNEKGKLCNGHLKQTDTRHASEIHLRGDDALHKCQTCGALYTGPPLGHVRDSTKQTRFVQRELAAILQAAGGTLPAYDYPPGSEHAPASARRAARPAPAAASSDARTASSSSEADRHRPAAEAQAATGQASAAPLSPAAATASPAAGAETASDLAPEASTELTPGAPKDERSA
jgi:hypothetical protein